MPSCAGLLICPVCGGELSDRGRSLQCAANHSFDRAREGYVDLLPAGHGRSKLRGDTAAMLQARRRVFERGYFEPLASRLKEISEHFLRERRIHARRVAIAEAGCGEGHYIGNLQRSMHGNAADCFFGFDISSDAVRLAARAYPRVSFFVNDVHHRICLATRSVDLLLDIFAPRNTREFSRVLRPDGQLIVVIPQESHLGELRAELALLRIDADKQEAVVEQLDRFRLVNMDALDYAVDLPAADALDLVRMTPSSWHLDDIWEERVIARHIRRVTIAASILRFQPEGAG